MDKIWFWTWSLSSMGVYIYYVIFYELIHQQWLWLFHSLREESYFLWLIHAGTESFNLFKNNSQLLLLGSMPYTWRLWSRYLLIVWKEQYWNLRSFYKKRHWTEEGRQLSNLIEWDYSHFQTQVVGLLRTWTIWLHFQLFRLIFSVRLLLFEDMF